MARVFYLRMLTVSTSALDDLAGARQALAAGRYRLTRCRIEQVLELTPEQWDAFAASPGADRPEWFAGHGGCSSIFETTDGRDYGALSDLERQEWQRGSFCWITVLDAPGRPPLYVDPQGYDYARYLAFPLNRGHVPALPMWFRRDK